MKQINITYEDDFYKEVIKAKEKHGGNWHDFVLDLARRYLRMEEKK
jgi:hypothetical protein